jgi:hypothetical protein
MSNELAITIRDKEGICSRRLGVPSDSRAGEIVEFMQQYEPKRFPAKDVGGRLIPWEVHSEHHGQMLDLDATLAALRIPNGDTLLLLPHFMGA